VLARNLLTSSIWLISRVLKPLMPRLRRDPPSFILMTKTGVIGSSANSEGEGDVAVISRLAGWYEKECGI
jgi:hypothetical protein